MCLHSEAERLDARQPHRSGPQRHLAHLPGDGGLARAGSVAYGGGGTVTDSAGSHQQQGLNIYDSIPGMGEWTNAAEDTRSSVGTGSRGGVPA